MEKAAGELQRAKGRHIALLCERTTQDVSEASHQRIDDEISVLESAYPVLVRSAAENTGCAINCQPSPSFYQGMSSSRACIGTNSAASHFSSLRSSPAPQPSAQTRLRKSAPPSLVMQTPASTAPLHALSTEARPKSAEQARKRPSGATGDFMIMFALQLFNERQQKSMAGHAVIFAIALVSVATALAHCTIVDPASVTGSLLSPSLLTLLVHSNTLCGLYVRGKRRFTAPKLIIYTVCDIVPSLGLSVMAYNLGLIALELYGFRRASFAC